MASNIPAIAALLESATRTAGFVISADGRVSEKDAAVLLGVAAGTMRNRRNGRAPIPYYRLGGRVTYRIIDLAAYIEGTREDW